MELGETKPPRGYVWVLMGAWDYEGSTLLGVFRNIDKLQKAEGENVGFDCLDVCLSKVDA